MLFSNDGGMTGQVMSPRGEKLALLEIFVQHFDQPSIHP
jgi:hypothetical protein